MDIPVGPRWRRCAVYVLAVKNKKPEWRRDKIPKRWAKPCAVRFSTYSFSVYCILLLQFFTRRTREWKKQQSLRVIVLAYMKYMAAWSKKHIAVDQLNVASIRSIPSSSHLISAQWCTSDRLLSAIGVGNWEKSSNWNIALFVVCLFDMQKNIACTTDYSVNENVYIIGICLDSVGFWCGAVRSS